VQKEDYQRFVASLVTATRHATIALRAAGTPSVAHGQQVAGRLTKAFDRATHGLETASTHLGAVRTDSASSFRVAVGAVSSEIRAALEQIALVPPGQSQELRSAAAKQRACQLLAG
jgi:hypothetical protein